METKAHSKTKSLAREVFAAPVEVISATENAVRAEVGNDRDAIAVFLSGFSRHSMHTQRAYRKELMKFWLWLSIYRSAGARDGGNLFASVGVVDAEAYLKFLEKPEKISPEAMAAAGFKKQPFGRDLNSASLLHAISVLNRFYEVLRNVTSTAGGTVCQRNPFLNTHAGGETTDGYIERALTQEEWDLVLEAIELLPQQTDREQRQYHRARWTFQLLFRGYLRRDEAARLMMRDFYQEGDDWSIRLSGKGNKRASIIATRRLMNELAIYRQSLGLPLLPHPKENLPAILSITGWRMDANGEIFGAKNLTNQAIYNLCMEIFKHASQVASLRSRGNPKMARMADRLSVATPHWMRHTGVSHAMEANVNPRFVQAQARHSSLKITARYDHKRRQSWREELERAEGSN